MIGVEHCDRCGFDRGQWNEQDAQRTLLHAADLLDGWSVDARQELIDQLDARRIDDLKAIEASGDLYDKVHHLWHGLVSIADVRRAADDAVLRQHGVVDQLNASGGGVPKTAVDAAVIGVRGVDGDTQATRLHHGRPWQALCLWSGDVIASLAADGHPIAPGNAGENITISGFDWGSLRGGTVIDGTGAPGRPADVAVSGGRIVAIGADLTGERELDAAGCVVAPGFIDIHTHFDGQVTWAQDGEVGRNSGSANFRTRCVSIQPCRNAISSGQATLSPCRVSMVSMKLDACCSDSCVPVSSQA